MKNNRVRFGLPLLGILLCVSSHLAAQDQSWNDKIAELSFMRRGVSDYRLGPGDLIEITVTGVDQLNSTVRISAGGEINIPYLGRITVSGMTSAELEEKLKTDLDGRFIKNPQVLVMIKEFKAYSVFILGAVNQPGQYQMSQPLTLIDLIAMAGGLDLTSADTVALVQRRAVKTPAGATQAEPGLDIIRVGLTELLESGSLEHNVALLPGDVVQIPARKMRRFFVLGDVNSPGVYGLPEKDLLLTQALAWAGGPSRTAKMNEGTLVRYDEQGGREEMAVNFKDVLSGKKEDFIIKENDIIFIPGSRFKNIGYAMLGLAKQVPQVIVTQGSYTAVAR